MTRRPPRTPSSVTAQPSQPLSGRSTHRPKTPKIRRMPDHGTTPSPPSQTSPAVWIYGLHAVTEALKNPRRTCLELLALPDQAERLRAFSSRCPVILTDKASLSQRLGTQTVHQGVALKALPLPTLHMHDLFENMSVDARFLILDQVTDPHNVGAILRSAAAFGVAAVIVTRHHSPKNYGVLAKTASGGIEHVPLIEVTNLARTLEELRRHSVWCYGLDGEATTALETLPTTGPIALVLGAEGEGLRRLTREHCDALVRINTHGGIRSLNVSNAAAIALHTLARPQ